MARPRAQQKVEVDLAMIGSLNNTLQKFEWHIEKTARRHDPHSPYLLRYNPGGGQILVPLILHEVHDIRRLPTVQDFSSDARLIKPAKESNGKWACSSNEKIGNFTSNGPLRSRHPDAQRRQRSKYYGEGKVKGGGKKKQGNMARVFR